MKKPLLGFAAILAMFLFGLALVFTNAAVQPKSSHERIDPLQGIVYYKHPTTGKLAIYVAYELRPNRLYRFDVTDDGVNFTTIVTRNTAGRTNDVYESFNVPDPCVGIWPRVVDLGPSGSAQ